MRLNRAINNFIYRYPNVVEYQDAYEYVYINDNDEDLQKWRIKQPTPPAWDEITGFGLKPKNQFFERENYPSRLLLLEQNIRKKILKNRIKKDTDFIIQRKIYTIIWETLKTQKKDYNEEIDWIKSQWYYLNHGKWIFINGKPIYLQKWHWFYLNYFELEDCGLPDFRYRDYKWFHAQDYAATTTETVDYLITKEEGGIIHTPQILEDGTLKMIKTKSRTVFGTNNLKGRRVGETSKSQCIEYCIAISKIDCNCGIQGNTENTAKDVYNDKLLYAFNRMAFFFIPEMPNYYTTSGLYFAGTHGKGGLNSKIIYATTAKKEFFDQKRLDFIHVDEIGKTKLENVVVRHGVIKRCCSAGDIIKGFMICTSTAEDMLADSGELFEKLTMDSMIESRLSNNQTKSGLVNVYFPMYEAYEGFIDKYGYPIINTPTKEQIPYMSRIEKDENGEIMGARAYLENIEKDLLASGDLNALAQHQRQHPKTFKECFALISQTNFFNIAILQKRILYLKFTKENKVRKGDFIWTGEPYNSKVVFVDNDNGHFKISMHLPTDRASKIIFNGESKMPGFDDNIIISADPYRFNKTDYDRGSKGAISVYRMFDEKIDGGKENAMDYETNNFICSYCYREDDVDKFSDAVLRCAIYFNALIYPEANVGSIQDYIIKKGYYGYLLFDVNPETGVKKNNCGFNTAGANIKQRMFTKADGWINLHAHKCNHIDILEDFLTIKGLDDTKNKDLFISSVGCLLGASSIYTEYIKRFTSNDGIDVSGWW